MRRPPLNPRGSATFSDVTARAAELLAIDLGTSSVKVGVFAGDGELLRRARRPYLAADDPEAWWYSTAEALREATRDFDLTQTHAVCVGGQGPTLVLVDATGQPVRNAIEWSDARATEQAERIGSALHTPGAASFSLVPRLLWVAENEPAALAQARWALQAWDFIAARLAGHTVAAASTFKGDVVWRADYLAAAGLSECPLIPAPVDAGVPYAETGGRWAAAASVPAGMPIVGGGNDGVGSIVGAAGSVVGRATDPGGAAGGLALCWNTRVEGPGVDCWAGLVPDTFIVGGAFAAGGRAMDWWAAIGANGDLPRALALAEQAPAGAGGLVFLPFLAGERSPLWDADARGAMLGLGFEHGPAHLARAVVESTGYQLHLLADAIVALGPRIEELRVCGGQAHSQFWNQVKADVLGLPASVPRLPDVALMCDAICAALGAGLYPDLESAGEAMVRINQVLDPNPAYRAIYDDLYGVYRDAYTALMPLFPRLRGSPPT